jgi:rSAM/selenodomain-associated transferase 1
VSPLPLNVAVFVKTPGLSPVKTRLAEGIGQARAEQFYTLACVAVREVLEAAAEELTHVQGHWAIAEAGADRAWPSLPTVAQGEGDLGQRLAVVYEEMRAKNRQGAAVLIGADAPQITPATFALARAALEDGNDFVIGPAADGGFYLFAGKRPLRPEVWTSVPYSQSQTTAELKKVLQPMGRVAMLGKLTDADTDADLGPVSRELAELSYPTPGQIALLKWLKAL